MIDVKSIDKKYNVRPFEDAPASKSGIATIELESIDLAKFKEGDLADAIQSRRELADQLEKSFSTYGFISVVNHGFSLEEIVALRSYAQSICELPIEEQAEHLAGAWKSDLEDRSISQGAERGAGFKPKGYWFVKNGVEDSIVHYNFRDMLHESFFDAKANNYPILVEAHLKEIAKFFRDLHNLVLRKITILCDIVLEKPEGFIWENYYKVIEGDYQNSGQGTGRFMLYNKLSREDQKKVDNNWLRGHSDQGGFTFITSQPTQSLQIRDYYTGEWRYVGHIPNSLIINVGDAMEFITGGFFKSSVHRVVAPPEDQRDWNRLVLIYFAAPKESCIVDPEPLESPKLTRLGYAKPQEWDKITFGVWGNKKGRLFGKKLLNDTKGDEPNLVLMHGRLHERWHQAEANFNLETAKKNFNIVEMY